MSADFKIRLRGPNNEDVIFEAYNKTSSKDKSKIKYHYTLRWTSKRFITLK